MRNKVLFVGICVLKSGNTDKTFSQQQASQSTGVFWRGTFWDSQDVDTLVHSQDTSWFFVRSPKQAH